jgi:signal transduction histidine kinase
MESRLTPTSSGYVFEGRDSGTAARRMARPLSLEYKLPLFMGLLLVVAIAALALAAVAEMRRSAMLVASERVTTVAVQLRDLFQQSATQLRTLSTTAARTPAFAEYATSRDAAARGRALAALRYGGPQPEQVVASELRNARGQLLISDAPALSARLPVPAVAPAAGDSVAVGAFVAMPGAADTLAYAISTPIPAPGEPVYLVRWRRLTGSRRSREQVSKLIGSGASLFLGTPGRSEWTNLERPVQSPPIAAAAPAGASIQRYVRDPDRSDYLAAVASVPGTPWMVVVDFPVAQVMAPVHEFIWRLAMISAALLAASLFAAWGTSRRLTAPIRKLREAATQIAAGDFAQRARITRSDELGQLGTAFDAMAAEVQHGRLLLEQRIDERTRELRDAQESLVRRERLAMLGQLSSGVGHELRNPLGVMTNAVYYLRMVTTDAPATVREYLDIVQQQITLSEKIVSDLLDFARSRPPQRKATPLREIVDAQIERLGTTEGLEIDVQFSDYVPPVLVDPVQLGQIVFNLLTNATQAMHGAGRLRLCAISDGERVQLEVEDSGPGIAPEHLEKVFEPLFTTKARGIGLGLSVSRTLARANGGDLTVRSVPGEGATFRLTLQPAASGERGAA